MRLTLVNLTPSPVLYHSTSTEADIAAPLQIALLPSSSTTADLPKRCLKLTLIPRSQLTYHSGSELGGLNPVEETTFDVHVKFLKRSRRCEVIDGGEGCPWRIYRTRVSRKHDKFLLFPYRELSSFLSSIPDTVPISSLLLPGTHETMAFYGWPFSQCQPSPSPSNPNPLLTQLYCGIRALDIRLSIVDGELIAFHGLYPQRTPFASILATLHQFLTAPECKSECILVSIKQEDHASSEFTALVDSTIRASAGGTRMWFTQSNRIPTLGEVRGRCVLFSRFGEPGREGLGIHPDKWPDSVREGFEWMCGETVVRISDWYAIPSFLSIPEKVSLSTSILLPLPTSPSLSITFFSAASIPLALPPTIARGFGWPRWGLGVVGVNERVGEWLLQVFSRESRSHSHSQFRSLPHSRLHPRDIPKLEKQAENEEDMTEKETHEEVGTGHSAIALGSGSPQEEEIRIRGWAFMDFYEDPIESGLVPLLVECNFRGRKVGEEGWQ